MNPCKSPPSFISYKKGYTKEPSSHEANLHVCVNSPSRILPEVVVQLKALYQVGFYFTLLRADKHFSRFLHFSSSAKSGGLMLILLRIETLLRFLRHGQAVDISLKLDNLAEQVIGLALPIRDRAVIVRVSG